MFNNFFLLIDKGSVDKSEREQPFIHKGIADFFLYFLTIFY